jgi:hypothetical protein
VSFARHDIGGGFDSEVLGDYQPGKRVKVYYQPTNPAWATLETGLTRVQTFEYGAALLSSGAFLLWGLYQLVVLAIR